MRSIIQRFFPLKISVTTTVSQAIMYKYLVENFLLEKILYSSLQKSVLNNKNNYSNYILLQLFFSTEL
jgi:hypothetical protein